MIVFLLFLIILIWVLYGPFADLLFHVLHITTLFRGDELKSEITLTFDDGPDPVYTPPLLDLLDQHKARAMFFVVGKTANAYPELLREIHNRGHLIGVHTEKHVNAWFTSPWRMQQEIEKTAKTISSITGTRPVFFRPPWGRFNLILPWQLHAMGMRSVLWTYYCRDWESGDRSRAIADAIMGRAQNGAIILLHDSGGAQGSPKNTLHALRIVLPRLQQIGFALTNNPVLDAHQAAKKRHVHVAKLWQRIIRPIWRLWDKIYDRMEHVYPMTRIFRLNLGQWQYGSRFLDGMKTTTESRQGRPVLKDGDAMVEMHMQLIALQELLHLSSPEKMAVRALREFRDSMHAIARAMIYDDRFRKAQGVFGYTLMHRGIERLGFHVETIEPTLNNHFISFMTKLIMVLHHPQGLKRLNAGLETMELRLVWMTREEILNRYYEEEIPSVVPTLHQLFDLYPLIQKSSS